MEFADSFHSQGDQVFYSDSGHDLGQSKVAVILWLCQAAGTSDPLLTSVLHFAGQEVCVNGNLMDSKLILCMTVIKSAKKMLSFFATSKHNLRFLQNIF